MFKLPVCPHCKTVYRYKDTVNAIKEKDNVCYHCHKKFKAKIFPYILVEAILLIALSIGANLLILSRLSTFNLFPLFAVTTGFLLIIIVMIPFFTRFLKTEDEKNTGNKRKK